MATRNEEVRVTADVSSFVRGMATAGAAASGLAKRLDEADGRMANIVQTGLALGPALVPLGAIAVPAITGLATQLGVAAVAAGTAYLAFQGVGTALKALETFKTAPTAANLAKVEQAMKGLGPAGQEFVLALDKLQPKIKALQATAQAGLFPGLTTGLNDIVDLMPRAQAIIGTTASALGELATQAARGLHDEGFRNFFDYLQTTLRPTLMQMGGTLGNFIEGIANLLVDFGPLSSQFSSGLLGISQSFKTWTAGLSGTKGFEDFVAYIRDNTPLALDALGSLAGALISIVEAAAPVGHELLPFITALGHALSSLADSSVGPLIISAAAAIGVLGRSLSILQTIGLRGSSKDEGISGYVKRGFLTPIKSVIPAMREFSSAQKEFQAAQRATASTRAVFLSNPGTVNAYSGALLREVNASERATAATLTRAAAFRASAVSTGKAAGAGGAMALAMSGVAANTGFANTATLALLGSVGGIPGAIAGGALGALMDMAQANNDVQAAVDNANRALQDQPGSLSANASAIDTASQKLDEFRHSIGDTGNFWNRLVKGTFTPGSWKNFTEDAFGKSDVQEQQDNLRDLQTEADLTRTRIGSMFEAFGKGKAANATVQELEGFVNDITPALQRVGLTAQDVFGGADPLGIKRIFAGGAIPFANLIDQSAAKKAGDVGAALANLRGAVNSTIDPVDALKTALDNLFGVKLNLSQSVDDATRKLHDMGKALKAAKGDLTGNGAKALDARDAVRAYAEAQINVAEAQAKAHHSGVEVANTLLATRRNFIDSARAAGINENAIRGMIRQMGLTPKNLVTIIRQDGALDATQKVRALATIYNRTPRQIRTLIAEAGAHPTANKISALAKQLHLTPRQVKIILSAIDNASRKAITAKSVAERLKGTYKAVLDAKDDASAKAVAARKKALALAKQWIAHLTATDAASPTTRAALALIHTFDGSRADAYIYTHRVTVLEVQRADHNRATFAPPPGSSKAKHSATGGHITGPGTATSDSIPAWLSNGEFVIRTAAVDHYGEDFFHRLNNMAYADGGSVGRRGYASGGSVSVDRAAASDRKSRAKEMKELTKELSKLREQIKQARSDRKEYASSTSQAFIGDPFQGTLGGFQSQVAHETTNLRNVKADLKTLHKRGLGGALFKDLAASGNVHLIDQFSKLSKSELDKYESQYKTRNKLDTAVGEYASRAVYGVKIQRLGDSIDALRHEIHALRHGKHIGNTNIHGRVTIKDSDTKNKTKTAAHRVRHA